MKKWFLVACLPLMIVSCDIFGLGDDGDDDDTMIVDPPMANVSFDYEDKILSGDTLYLRLMCVLSIRKFFSTICRWKSR